VKNGVSIGMKMFDRRIEKLLDGALKLRMAGKKPARFGGVGKATDVDEKITRFGKHEHSSNYTKRLEASTSQGDGQPKLRLIDKTVNRNVQMMPAHSRKYDDFRSYVNDKNMHPKNASDAVGASHYERLKGSDKKDPTYSMRLSHKHRVEFSVDDVKKQVTVKEIRGHYED